MDDGGIEGCRKGMVVTVDWAGATSINLPKSTWDCWMRISINISHDVSIPLDAILCSAGGICRCVEDILMQHVELLYNVLQTHNLIHT